MSNKSQPLIFFILLIIAVLGIVGYRFDRYYIAKDYVLNVFTPCDPASHSCFEADQAVADPNFQTGPYEKVEITARYASFCLEEHTCLNFSCPNTGVCSIIYCSEGTKDPGETCSASTSP